jgi:putative component of toxin-antitoxin plasmid stabilization module
MKIRVEEYIRPDGSNPYKVWFDSLDAQAAAKVATAKIRMLFGGGTKKRQQADIGRAQALHVEYKAQKALAEVGNIAKKRRR